MDSDTIRVNVAGAGGAPAVESGAREPRQQWILPQRESRMALLPLQSRRGISRGRGLGGKTKAQEWPKQSRVSGRPTVTPSLVNL